MSLPILHSHVRAVLGSRASDSVLFLFYLCFCCFCDSIGYFSHLRDSFSYFSVHCTGISSVTPFSVIPTFSPCSRLLFLWGLLTLSIMWRFFAPTLYVATLFMYIFLDFIKVFIIVFIVIYYLMNGLFKFRLLLSCS